MKKLTRITLEGINELAIPNEVIEVGRGTIMGSRNINKRLILKLPKETRKIKTSIYIMGTSRPNFLEYVDKFLKENKLYLTDVEYRKDKALNFLPHKLKGMFYKERTKEII